MSGLWVTLRPSRGLWTVSKFQVELRPVNPLVALRRQIVANLWVELRPGPMRRVVIRLWVALRPSRGRRVASKFQAALQPALGWWVALRL